MIPCRRCGSVNATCVWKGLLVCPRCSDALDLWEFGQKALIRRLVQERTTLKLKVAEAMKELDVPVDDDAPYRGVFESLRRVS